LPLASRRPRVQVVMEPAVVVVVADVEVEAVVALRILC
jgi:hypothetical protein